MTTTLRGYCSSMQPPLTTDQWTSVSLRLPAMLFLLSGSAVPPFFLDPSSPRPLRRAPYVIRPAIIPGDIRRVDLDFQ